MDGSVSKWPAADAAATEQAVTLCLYSPTSVPQTPPRTVCCYIQIIKRSSMLYLYAFMLCVIMFHLCIHSLVISSVSACIRG